MNQELIKELLFGEECRESLMRGVSVMSKAVASTLGPYGRTCLLESPLQTHGFTNTKDGFTVAKSISLNDPVENLACRILLEAAERTATSAGDGTSTSIVLAEALILEGNKRITEGINKTQVLRYMTQIVETVVEKLREKSIPCDENIILDVATISSNGDDSIGKIIAEAYKGVGKDGIVTVEKSLSSETYSDVTNGLKIDRGYSSPMFINNREKDECVMENVNILVCDGEISNILQIETILKDIISNKKKLLIIAPCHTNLVNTLAGNVMKGNISACVITPPSFGYKSHELMEDIALSVGATYFSEKTGDDLSHITMTDLGLAAKVIVGKNKTVIVSGSGDKGKLNQRIGELKNSQEITNKKADKDFINERIAGLIGGIGVIYVGGNTDLEQKEIYDRVEDAVCAVKSALEEGVVSGAGKALFEIDLQYPPESDTSKEYSIALDIVLSAIKVPLVQVLANADLSVVDIYGNRKDVFGHGYNVKTGQYGNLIEMGVADPMKVTRVALQNACAVACTILSTSVAVTIARAS